MIRRMAIARARWRAMTCWTAPAARSMRPPHAVARRQAAGDQHGWSHASERYLDDYCISPMRCSSCRQVRFRGEELGFARQLLEVVLAHFSTARRAASTSPPTITKP